MSPTYQTIKYDDLQNQIDSLITNRKSFVVIELKQMADGISIIENAIERANLTCRVYSAYRSTVAAGLWLFPLAGATYTAMILGHRLGTHDPDYEIAKRWLLKQIEVTYKR